MHVTPSLLYAWMPTAWQETFAAAPWLATLVNLVLLLVVGGLVQLITRRLLIPLVKRITARTTSIWADALLAPAVLNRAAWVVSFFVFTMGAGLLPAFSDDVRTALQTIFAILTTGAFGAMITGFFNAVERVYRTTERGRQRPIKGIVQTASLVVWVFVAVIAIAYLTGTQPLVILSGFGALSAVLLLVFQNTILSFVAGIQLTANDLIRVGDWIEMPQFNADGDVVDIALNYVTVQNWDKTVTVIPAHNFLQNAFKNWRAMQETGGRRIKRPIMIDMSTIRFLTDEEITNLERFHVLRPYLTAKEEELAQFHQDHPELTDSPVNMRRMTNIGTFRAYVMAYLRANPMIHPDLTFLVRQLEPTPEGVPLEIYVFVADTRWAIYEGVQGDIFDHLLAVLPEFGLRVFQSPSGRDIREIAKGPRSDA